MAAGELNAQRRGAAELRQPLGTVVGFAGDAVTDLLPAKPGAHKIAGGVVGVVHHHAGVILGKQAALGVFVILKIRVLAGADVILGQIGEGHDLKRHAVHAVVAQRLAAHFQYGVVHAGVHHLAEQPVQFQAFGRRVGGGLVLAGNVHPVGADVGAGHPPR